MKRILLTAFAVLSIAGAGTAMAAPIVLPEGEPLFIKFNNIELVDVTNTMVIPSNDPYYAGFTQGNWGLVVLESIRIGTVAVENELVQTGNPQIFVDQILGGGQVTGIFYDIQLTSPFTATGGFLDLFWQDGTSLNLGTSSPSDVDLYTQGTFLARIAFTPGILGSVGDCETTIFTLQGVNTEGTGVADSYGNVDTTAGGSWAASLDGNWFNNPCTPLSNPSTDVRFKNSFNRINDSDHPWFGDGANQFGLTSDDPAQAFTADVPEPASLALLGLGLLGFAARARRRHA